MTITDRIFEKIKERGMTQKEFCEKTGIPQSTVSDWKGKAINPSSDKIMIICEVLGVNPYEILSGTESSQYATPDMMYISKDSDEYYLIEGYRSLNKSQRGRVIGYVDALSEAIRNSETS